MKGIIFNVLEEFVEQNVGADVFDELLDTCDLETKDPFVGPGTYPTQDFLKLVVAATEKAGLPLEDVVKAFGKFTFPKLYEFNPTFIDPYKRAKDFLLTVHDIIHVEVKKLYEDSELPSLRYEDISENELMIEYTSPRNLCLFMEGLLDGVKEHFKEDFEYKQIKCIHEGDETCLFHLKFNYE